MKETPLTSKHKELVAKNSELHPILQIDYLLQLYYW